MLTDVQTPFLGTALVPLKGEGADIVVCGDGVVRRYWVTSETLPAAEEEVGRFKG